MTLSAQTKANLSLTEKQCPLTGNCLESKIIYQATVQPGDNEEKYI